MDRFPWPEWTFRDTSTMTDARIRQARPEDSASWLRLRRFLWPRCSEQKHDLEMGQLLKSGGTVFLVENEQGQPIGFAEVSLRHDHVDGASICPVPYLEAWFVEPKPAANAGDGRLVNGKGNLRLKSA